MRRALATLVLATCIWAPLAGCGREKVSAVDVVAQAAAKTSGAGTSRMSLVVDVTVPSGEPQRVTAEGAIDYVAHKGSLTMDVGTLGGALKGKVEVLMAEDIVYVKLPEGSGPATTKPWLRVAAGTEGSGGFGVFGAGDPSGALAALSGADAVTEVGREDVRGTATVHYRAVVDLAKAASKAGARKADVERLDAALEGETVPMDVWVDGDGRARRLQMQLEPQGNKTIITVELYDFGVDVEADPPPASLVTDLSGLNLPTAQG